MKTLVIEDDIVTQKIIARILTPYGTVNAVSTGADALSAFYAAWDENAPYQLICLDVHLPDAHGLDILRVIREKERQENVSLGTGATVFVITVERESASVAHAFKTFCNAYLFKPINQRMLMAQLLKMGLLVGGTEG